MVHQSTVNYKKNQIKLHVHIILHKKYTHTQNVWKQFVLDMNKRCTQLNLCVKRAKVKKYFNMWDDVIDVRLIIARFACARYLEFNSLNGKIWRSVANRSQPFQYLWKYNFVVWSYVSKDGHWPSSFVGKLAQPNDNMKNMQNIHTVV